MLGAMARNHVDRPARAAARQVRLLHPRPRRASGCPEGRGLTVAVAVTVSPDGRNVYVASEDTYLGSVAIFRRLAR